MSKEKEKQLDQLFNLAIPLQNWLKENSKTCFHMWSHPKKFWSLAFIEVSEIMKPMGIKLIEVSYILGTSFHPMGGSWYLLTENDALRLRDALFFLCSPKLDGDQG